ncbi:prepilin-type N-terminal cleavage/methylation domain-containing protein [Chromatium okenii]|jgi:general secretion pathway protein J|uniref:prepilin-type N-terminal cleavage/methylation domain-containing protein n=1 Tax=Chromatium okenii TaxID=61644 RepID=UPI0026E98E75|nr:prepilin-type N-terminal cleavage/methylation domain-containing protein [Chromatium okenii]MBV5310772.1 prepilin-type N-terminal cleavage/methylation domain-containing protein [Chromatium okenii]
MTPNFMLHRGFTLVELLIALALISLITLLLFSGLRLGTRAWEAVDAAAEHTGELRLAQGFLMRVLSQTEFTTITAAENSVVLFRGDSTHLECAAPLSEHVGIAGRYALRLSVEQQGKTQALILTRWLLHPEILNGGNGVPTWTPLDKDATASLAQLPMEMDAAAGAFGRTSLLDQVDTFALAYYGKTEDESEPSWHEDWFDQPHLPLLLRIQLTTPFQAWPDLVIALPRQLN